MKIHRFLFCLFLLLILLVPQCMGDQEHDAAEVNAYVMGDIPTIMVNNWTAVKFRLEDRCGINWTSIKDEFNFELDLESDNLLHIILQHFKRGYSFVLWKILPSLPQPIERYLGYTSFELNASIIAEKTDGWHVKIEPNTIRHSTTGFNHNFTLYAKVDDAEVDYAVTIVINCTRIDALGGIYGYSMIYLPLKVFPTSYVSASNLDKTITISPKSVETFSFDVTNRGYYKNVFYFNTITSTDTLRVLVHQQAAVIQPGKTKKIDASILTPESIVDFGTPHTIEIYTTTSLNNSFVHIGSITVITKGIYLSSLNAFLLCTIVVILIACIFVLRRYKRRKGHPAKDKTA